MTLSSYGSERTGIVSRPPDVILGFLPYPALEWRIVPGVRIGKVTLGLGPDALRLRLGSPIDEPSGGHSPMRIGTWDTWRGQRGNRLDVHSTRRPPCDDFTPLLVDAVRVTSTRFRLSDGLRVGSRSNRLLATFPAAKHAGTYRTREGMVAIWDAAAQGLAWEARGGRTTALWVHRREKPLDASARIYFEASENSSS